MGETTKHKTPSIGRRDYKALMGRPGGKHDPRPRRQRTRGAARREAIRQDQA